MPINNEKQIREFPVQLKFGKKPENKFVNLLENINVSLVQFPEYDKIKNYAISFATATYEDEPFQFIKKISKCDDYRERNKIKDLIMHKIFSRELLPGTLETFRLNFKISGITIQEVTHILRYRKAVFSAECSGEKWWTDKTFCVPTSIQNSKEYYERYTKICKEATELYADMVDSEKIHLRDARYILPRATETFYFMSMNLGDAIGFINDRVDMQIQPEADNVLAYQMLLELLYAYPILVKTFGRDILKRPAKFYVNSVDKTLGSCMFPPNEYNDKFEYNEKSFMYNKTRDKFNGTDSPDNKVFEMIFDETQKCVEAIDNAVDSKYGPGFFSKDVKLSDIL
jgi:thymidylate synthase (FAD)